MEDLGSDVAMCCLQSGAEIMVILMDKELYSNYISKLGERIFQAEGYPQQTSEKNKAAARVSTAPPPD